jgi:hypothetical protein
MLIPFGILSAAGVSAGPTGAYDLISTTILGSTTASVTFSNLGDYSSIYKHLQLRITSRSPNTEVNGSYLTLRFNGVSTSTYDSHWLFGSGSAAGSFALPGYAEIYLQRTANANSAANAFGASLVDILDPYSSTKNKTVRYQGGSGVSTGLWPVTLGSGLWRNTASVTSITIGGDSTMLTGSRLSLYGIKG